MKARPDLLFISLLSLLSLFPAGLAERHSLTYIYTAFSKPTLLPGIHEFTAMGLVDDTMIDYFDSDLKRKVPKQPWMAERMEKNYWEKGTQSRLSKQTWFRVNIGILMERLRQNDNDTHILQWMHGCESIMENGIVKFYEGKDTYSYDGEDFLHFDDKDGVWISANPAAQDTKRKWDEVQTLKDYTKGYLENECLRWLNQFVGYGRKQHQAAPPPDMFMFAKKSKTDSNVILTCLASGFLQKDAELKIRRNGRLLDNVDGVKSSNVRPNNDDTYQTRHSVEILKTDESEYTCEVIHEGSGLSVTVTWDHKLPADGSGLIMYVVAALSLVVIMIIVVGTVLFLRKKGKCGGTNKDLLDIESNNSSQNKDLLDNGSKGSGSTSSSVAGVSSVSSVSTVSTDSGESKNPSENEALMEK
ncbi:BOLA class I histocompatibility antigen, alpha chain BL3-7 [Hippoglossus stenolepis]|uniref:BOLA class I histocompatibility antigen, alpha chain BL3-7 n=1 Tax=Hippoglossus stenolepis TaxID=195615 RepID=UPI00159C9761|nr:BOLA class I histocompatibility antigen, alpha chain BL3-7 [Hippoglossus stenolepis]